MASSDEGRLSLAGPVRVLAPMVRLGTLPLRLLAVRHGASAVFSEEIIARKLAGCVRRCDPRLGTVDFVPSGSPDTGGAVFRTHSQERHRVVLQLGAADPETAVEAAVLAAGDVAGVDLNMGCPKHAAVEGGMGVALLRRPERALEIVRALRAGLPAAVHLSCKIRLLDSAAATLEVCRRLASAGAEAISVHCRGPDEPATAEPRWCELAPVVAGLSPVPVLANGGIMGVEQRELASQQSGCAGVMIGRGALRHIDIFNATQPLEPGPASLSQQLEQYSDIAVELENPWLNSRFVLQWMLHEAGVLAVDPRALSLERASSLEAVAAAVGRQAHFDLAPRGVPRPATHHYGNSRQYFRTIGAAYFEPARLVIPKTNAMFARMVASRRQMAESRPKRRKKEQPAARRQLAELLKRHRMAAPRYELAEQAEAEQRVLGYFAKGFKMSVHVNGKSFECSKFARSKELAGDRAAGSAFEYFSALLEPEGVAVAQDIKADDLSNARVDDHD